jgi:predicted DCC family thiol-disulfide oxidoreductase YuxK
MAAERIFYDGNCGLCHRSVRFVISHDRDGSAFRFAPLDSEAFRSAVPEARRPDPDSSMVVITAQGAVLTRSAAVMHIWRRIGGFWKVFAGVAAMFPARVRDWGYDLVARTRHRLFEKPVDACPVLPPHLRERFDM